MRLCFRVAFAILIAVGVQGVDRTATVNGGDFFNFSVITFPHDVTTCHLKTPSGEQFDFQPGNKDFSTDKYVIREGSLINQCEVIVTNFDKNDEGIWEMFFTSEGGEGSTQIYIITVASEADTSEEKKESEEVTENPDDVEIENEHIGNSDLGNITYLSTISHFTKESNTIDISLSRESFIETCYVGSPNGHIIKAEELAINGVIVHNRSDFVSCRITIGPMNSNLLGEWKLCGQSEVNNETRCQPVNITWNSNNGIANWDSVTRQRFNHTVHFGGAVHPGVSGSGDIITCHIVTPAGEDLVLSSDVKYPHVERMIVTTPLCSVLINDITENMLGDWIIYSRFRTVFGQNEVRLPITLSLYNEDDPYEQAFNVTVLQNEPRLVNLGTNLTLQVTQTRGVVEDCIYTTPSGETFNRNTAENIAIPGVTFNSSSTEALCQIILNPISEESVGEWQIIGKFINGILFDERRQTFEIIKEDPLNPIKEDFERVIETLTPQTVITSMESSHRFVINTASFVEHESCHLITPEGLQYAFIDGFNVPGVEIVYDSRVQCGVQLKIESDEMIGQWSLIARATRLSVPIERRLPFNIRVEDNFILHNDINITEGADLYLHLDYSITIPETCKLYFGSDELEYTEAESDPVSLSRCGFIIRNVNENHTGKWIVEYGYSAKRRGSVNVNVLDSRTIAVDSIQWTIGESVDIVVGPADAVYCKLEDSTGHTMSDDFGPCKIVLDRVTVDHRGTWKMFVAVPGSVMLQEHGFYVDVRARDGGPVVTTTVERNAPSVMLTCSVPVENEVHACKFRDPSGNILVAAHGVGQDGYMFNGSSVNYESDAHSNDCTLRLINPTVQDLGIWRCAIDTSTGTYYGFLTVVCPHLMEDPQVAASIVTEPELKPDRDVFSYLEDEPAVVSCSTSSQLRYCYFRARNGTVFNVFPGMLSDSFEYVGAGLDSGDCGIRFKSLSAHESGNWTCHAGLVNITAAEQLASVSVHVRAKMTVRHYWHASQAPLVIEAMVYDSHPLDYCRFVRMNGQGFTSDNLPEGYFMDETMHRGYCTLYVRNPNIIDLHPWTIAAKITGQDGEIIRTTTDNLLVFIPRPNILGEILFWLLILSLCLIPVSAGVALIPKKNREWTNNRASRLSRSFRNSWRNTFQAKKPLKALPQEENIIKV